MAASRVILASTVLVLELALLVACEREAPRDTVRLQVEEAPDYMNPDAERDAGAPSLSEEAAATVGTLQTIIESNSIYRLARFADSQPGFISNFAGASHREHWDLLRRTGFDPILRLEDLLEKPYGTRSVGEETWYVWPDLAALDSSELQPERLNFRQRTRLEDLVGDAGVEKIRNGSGYPGVRMAIASDGRWLYYVHETQSEE